MSEASRLLLLRVLALGVTLLFGAIALRGMLAAVRRGLVHKELLQLFASPIAWFAIAASALVNGFLFVALLELYARTPNVPIVQIFFSSGFFWILQLALVPLITMRSFAAERTAGTIEPLLTAPVRASEVVWGKFLGAFVLYLALWLPTVALLGAALYYASPPGFAASLWALRSHGIVRAVPEALARIGAILDFGPVLSAYLGTALLGAAWVAVGVLASAVSRTQIVAYILAAVLLAGTYALGELPALVPADSPTLAPLREALSGLSLPAAFAEFSRGVIDLRRVLLLLTTSGLALFFATRAVESERWR
ncbi:MAG: hypothetical protein D6776_04060 [Planctomycetota bacterium]|nr:MAG: hypothetical protein D6776_04060 [Planctomycetota bacterium]